MMEACISHDFTPFRLSLSKLALSGSKLFAMPNGEPSMMNKIGLWPLGDGRQQLLNE